MAYKMNVHFKSILLLACRSDIRLLGYGNIIVFRYKLYIIILKCWLHTSSGDPTEGDDGRNEAD